MVHRCCISSCGMSVRVLEAKGLSYHKFPTKEPIRDQWVQAIIPHLEKPESFKIVPRYTRVCSRHFRKKDYCMDAKKRARLNSNAVPSVFPRKGTPVVIPTVLPVSPNKSSNVKSQAAIDCVPGTSSKSDNVQEKTAHGPPSSSLGFIKDETRCSLPSVAKIERHQLDDLLGTTELVIESATIQDDHLVLTVMDPLNLHGEAGEPVYMSNSDDQSQASGNSITEATSEEGTGMKRRKRRKWNRTAFARPAKGKRKSVKSEPVSVDDDVESASLSGVSCTLSSSAVDISNNMKQEFMAEVRSHEVITSSLLHDRHSVSEDAGTSLSNVTLLFSDLPNQPYQIASVEQELLQSIQAVSLKSGGDTEDGNELQVTATTTTTDEAYPYNNLIPAFLHHSSEESLFSNESQNPGGPNEYQFHAVSHAQADPELTGTTEDDSLRFELVDLRIDPEMPSAPAPSYLDIDELAHQLNSSLFTDGKISLFSTDTLNLGGDSSNNLNIAEDLFKDPTEDINSKIEFKKQLESTSSTISSAPPLPTFFQNLATRPETKQTPKKGTVQRAKGKSAKVNKSQPPPPPSPVKDKKLKGVTKRPKKEKITGKFSVERFKSSDKDIEYYTGFATFRNFESFFRSLEAYIEKLCITDATYGVNNLPNTVDKTGNCSTNPPSGEDGTSNQKLNNEPPKKRSCQGRAMSRINELFMTIIRLRRKLPEKVLGHMFFISQPTVSRVVRAWTVLLSKIIDSYPVESSSSTKGTHKEHSYTSKGLGVPEAFRELFYSDLAKSIVLTSLNPKKVKSKSSSSGSVRNKKSKMSVTVALTDVDSSSHISDCSVEDKSGDADSEYYVGLANPKTASPIEQSKLFDF